MLRINKQKVLPEYAYYYWEFLYLLGRAARYEKQPTNIKNFKLMDFLKSEMIRYPENKKDQEKIIEILKSLNEEITLVTEVSRLLDGIRFSLSRDLLEGILSAGGTKH